MDVSYEGSREIFSGNLDYSIPPTNISTISNDFVPYWPQPGFKDDDQPIIFNIQPTSSAYTSLSESFLYFKLKITKSDGTNLDSSDSYAPSENFLASYLASVNISLQDTPISRSQNTTLYSYQHFLENLLGHSEGVKKSTLSTELFYLDNGTSATSSDNLNFLLRKKLVANSNSFEVIGSLHHPLATQTRLIPDSVGINITIRKNSPNFCLVSPEVSSTGANPVLRQAPTPKIIIEECVYYVKRCQIHPKILALHNSSYNGNKRMNFLMRNREIKAYQLNSGCLTWSEILHNGPTPNFLLIGVVTSKQFMGQLSTSPFDFKQHGINSLSVYVEGESANLLRTINLEDGQSLLAFNSLKEVIPYAQLGHGLDRNDFKNRFLVAVELQNSENAPQFQLKSTHQTKLEIRFSTATTEPLTLLVLSEFPSLVQISKDRTVYSDAVVL